MFEQKMLLLNVTGVWPIVVCAWAAGAAIAATIPTATAMPFTRPSNRASVIANALANFSQGAKTTPSYASCAAFFFCTRTFCEFEVSSSQASVSETTAR